MLTTHAVVDWVPLSFFMLPFGMLLNPRHFLDPRGYVTLFYFGMTLLAWYPISCLIVSGTKSWLVRFGLFCLMSWSVYFAVVLWTGVGHPLCC